MQADRKLTRNLSPLGAWAFSIGTSIGWGSLVVTSNTYLAQAGPLGSTIGMIIGGHDFTNDLVVTVGTASLKFGAFIQAIINFLAVALCLFFVIKTVNKLKKPKAPEPAKPAAKPDDVVLLEEIRDLLKKQNNNRPAQRSNSGNRSGQRRNSKKEENPEAPKEA